jgi:MFS transporter, DHA1 family, multidrug resistance protein
MSIDCVGAQVIERVPPFWLIATVTMTGTAAMHMLVPALPMIARDLDTSQNAAQLTMTCYLMGMAVGQLIYGPLSDRFGRRPLLLTSQAVYILGLLIAAVATRIELLLIARIVQSVGACGALVLGRAVVRDLSGSKDATRRLAVLTVVINVTPAVAPSVGEIIIALLGCRAIFVVMVAIVGGLFLVALRQLPETNHRPIVVPGLRASRYFTLWMSPNVRRLTIAGACGATSLYGFFAAAPFLITGSLHEPPVAVGLLCMMAFAAMIVGNWIARRLSENVENMRAARVGNAICLVCAVALTGVAVTHHLTAASLMLLIAFYAVGVGIMSPNALAGLMNLHPEHAGIISSLYGFMQMAAGALFTLLASTHYSDPKTSVAVQLLIVAGIAAVSLIKLGTAPSSRPEVRVESTLPRDVEAHHGSPGASA